MGAIQAAILAVLGQACEPLSTGEVHERVARRMGRTISQDTVNSFLSVAARDAGSPVRPIGPGLYVIEKG